MAWIEERQRTHGGTSVHVRWRLGGGREGRLQVETFSAGSDEQNLARAEGFTRMVDAAGQFWPDGWVKGEGFVRSVEDRYSPPPPPPEFAVVAEEYVRSLTPCSGRSSMAVNATSKRTRRSLVSASVSSPGTSSPWAPSRASSTWRTSDRPALLLRSWQGQRGMTGPVRA